MYWLHVRPHIWQFFLLMYPPRLKQASSDKMIFVRPSIYIHNWSIQPFSQFLTPVMLCVLILYISGTVAPSLKSTPGDRFFEKLFRAIFIYSQSLCQKSAERKLPKKYFSYFILMSGLGLEPWLIRLISQHTTY